MQGSLVEGLAPRNWSLAWNHAEAPADLLVVSPRLRIFLISFTMLFFELLCIRWIPAYVRYLAYFNNFLLLASFLGIGLGILAARRERFWFPPFPIMVFLLVIMVTANRFELHINSTDVLYYGAGETQGAQGEQFIILPIIFGLVTACFIPLARPLGLLFTRVKPLTAYTYDIIGSLVGTAAFFLVALFSLPPTLWFIALAVPVLLLSTRRTTILAAIFLLACLIVVTMLQRDAYWSPYYRILVEPAQPRGYFINVNNSGHQAAIPWQDKEPFYRRVYDLFPGQSFQNALILGAGSGSDTSTALAYGVQSITAVEIDPTIQRLGVELHPDHPYSDPRVNVVINDGRAFLRNTDQKYDLIIFALPDSLTLTSSNTSLRLESFLLTEDSLKEARSHLSDNGLLVLYNYYREDWLVEKLAGMVGRASGQAPLVSTYGGWGRAAVIMAGPRLNTLPPGAFGPYREDKTKNSATLGVIGEGYYPVGNRPSATDDWPFLYLQQRSFPLLYISGLIMVAIFSIVGIATLVPRRVLRRFDWHMFFLGVAFMLLEVKSLTTFALLFGSTWLVNSLVFFAILSSVLLAVLANARLKIKRIGIFYTLLFGVLVVNVLVPPEALLFGSPIVRYLVASILAFAPVFLANVIFSNAFRDSDEADVAFASNLLGIMVGGMLEYFSMLIGYHLLLIPVIIFYALAMLLRRRQVAAAIS